MTKRKNRGGRPRAENPRNIPVSTKLTPEENKAFEALAKSKGLTKGRLLYNMILEQLK